MTHAATKAMLLILLIVHVCCITKLKSYRTYIQCLINCYNFNILVTSGGDTHTYIHIVDKSNLYKLGMCWLQAGAHLARKYNAVYVVTYAYICTYTHT